MAKVVLIHSCMDDYHALAVQKCLAESLNQAAVVLAREECFDKWAVSIDDDDIFVEAGDGNRYCTEDIIAVYLRRDYITEPSWVMGEGLDESTKDFLAEQRSFHVESMFRRLAESSPFINTIEANRQAGSKVLQHFVARRCGISVPRTYEGSDPTRAETFAQTLWAEGRRCCTKNIESTQVRINGSKHARLTKMFAETDLPALNGLRFCPMIFQEYVEKRFEYRVTVVGNEVYACRIDSQRAGGKTAIDWRHYNIAATPHHSAQLGPILDEQLVRLVHLLGLTYGAIDLVETPEGQFFLLEVNSMGQWLWIEDMTELPISMAIARHLMEPDKIRQRPILGGNAMRSDPTHEMEKLKGTPEDHQHENIGRP